jgi:hypothetical protein
MPRRSYLLAIVGAFCVALQASAQELPPDKLASKPPWESAANENPNDNGNSKDKDEDKGNGKDKEKKKPEHMRDNGFLVEEAFNQEPGVVQHILTWVNQWDRSPLGRTRDFTFNYTMEVPLFSQKHQFSFTTQLPASFEEPVNAEPSQLGGLGDTLLSYRYQLLANDDFLWAAPRFTLMLPTGDKRFGLGTGRVGYQFNLPVSRYGNRFDFHFNGGVTFVPSVSVPLPSGLDSPSHDLWTYNLGLSAYWKPRTNLHFFLETLALWTAEINDLGGRDNFTQVFVNPGLRYAVCQLEDVEWVVGASVPIGLNRSTPDIGIFIYLSVEHTFRKIKKNGED